MTKYKALDVARYVINYAIEKDHPVSNLQLQKIMYYVQAAFLVETDDVIFNENILNWTYGPVIEEVYREFKEKGYMPITEKQEEYLTICYDKKDNKIKIVNLKFDKKQFKSEEIQLINKVVDVYIGMDVFDLVEKTHLEDPWRKSRQNEIISIKSIKEYYTKCIEKLYNLPI